MLFKSVLLICPVLAAVASGEAAEAEPALQGAGLCQFRLHQYTLPAQTEAAINRVIGQTLADHQRVFGFTAAPDFHVRFRIFGRFEDYEQFTRTNRLARFIVRQTPDLTNLNGYYSHAAREVVTWRQNPPDYLANNLLHEASHAILLAHYRRVPPWISEGCATYFSYPNRLQDAHDIGSLKYRWAKLRRWQRDQKLPELRSFLNLDDAAWHKLDLNLAYTVSWSLFQFLMSTDRGKPILRQLMADLQTRGGPKVDCAELLNQAYSGGLKRLERDWHGWIERGAAKVLGPDLEEILKQVK